MAVGAPATKLHLSTATARRPSLLHLAGVAMLCSVSYLLGIWHNGSFSAVPSGSAVSSISIATTASVSYPKHPRRRGHENLHNSVDDALLLKRKSEDVLFYLNGRCIYLVGMMGSGKSTIGKIIAEVLGYSFFDSDKLVEQAVDMPLVAQIFKVHSESFFRDNESSVLRDLSSMRRLVVATGGGAVIRPVNWKYMKKGSSVWLDVSLEALARRIAGKSKKEQD